MAQNKAIQRVLIVGSESLFTEGLHQLLTQDDLGLEVSNIAYTTDTAFIQEIAAQRPTVIVLFDNGPLGVRRTFDLINAIPGLSIPRVIMVLVETSTVDIYHKQQIKVTRGNDLVDIIEGRNTSDELG